MYREQSFTYIVGDPEARGQPAPAVSTTVEVLESHRPEKGEVAMRVPQKTTSVIASGLAALSLACCGGSAATYTLYRNSVLNEGARLHVATFNADEGEAYNRENCAEAARLFQARADVKTKFWCEKGLFVA